MSSVEKFGLGVKNKMSIDKNKTTDKNVEFEIYFNFCPKIKNMKYECDKTGDKYRVTVKIDTLVNGKIYFVLLVEQDGIIMSYNITGTKGEIPECKYYVTR